MKTRFRSALVLILLIVPLSSPLGAQTLNTPVRPSSLENTLGIRFRSLVSARTLAVLGAAGLATGYASEEIDESQHVVLSKLESIGPEGDLVLDIGNTYGSGWLIGAGALGILGTGAVFGGDGLQDLGADLCRSLAYSGLTTGVIKHAVNRKRPSGGALSFPSGHTAAAFSTVPVIWHHVGWAAGVGTAILATATGLGRMEDNRHYLSDVISGAAIGIVFGQAVIDHRKQTEFLDGLRVTGSYVGYSLAF